jgi:hypothetical protein
MGFNLADNFELNPVNNFNNLSFSRKNLNRDLVGEYACIELNDCFADCECETEDQY